MPYWKKQVAPPFFSQAKRGPIRQPAMITPHPEIITKIMDNKGNLQSNKQSGGNDVFEKPKKEKKKPIPGIRLLKKYKICSACPQRAFIGSRFDGMGRYAIRQSRSMGLLCNLCIYSIRIF